jgi:hypothetical protein
MAPGLGGQAGAAGAVSGVAKQCGIGVTWAGENYVLLCCGTLKSDHIFEYSISNCYFK